MGKPTGFLEISRQDPENLPVTERIRFYREFTLPLGEQEVSRQGSRCMDCGIPFCQTGCPVNNIIPDWNDLVYRGRWMEALAVLHSTNNFPEFTGRVCPAPCEEACTLNINIDPVTIKNIEHAIIDKGWENGWVQPQPALRKSGKRVAIVGSGPSGLACAQQLARAGHAVTVFEKNNRPGGLLRYGIPDFKLEKSHVDRRIGQMVAEGVEFRFGQHVGVNLPARTLLDGFDAVVLAGGSEHPRDLQVPGRELQGIHFAMDFLPQQNRRIAGDRIPDGDAITATGKHVVVIGGGDTGSDCVGTSIRQGALSVTQIELLTRPPEKVNGLVIWPDWPAKLRTSTSQQEGVTRDWGVTTKAFSGKNGRVGRLHAARIEWRRDGRGASAMHEVPGSEFELQAELVLLALGYLHPVHAGMLKGLEVGLDGRGNVAADDSGYRTSVSKVFAAGDMRRGQSLVVWAIREGRQTARAVDEFLMGSSDLPR
ncbi:MAG: glutamate synthase subunit beta [Acidiferrobacterales bacterium]